MIFPFSHTNVSTAAIASVADRLNILVPYSQAEVLTPAILCASMGMRNPREVLREEGFELGHFTVSFYIESGEISSILALSDARCLKLSDDAYIVTHDILGWKDMITRGLVKSQTPEVRRVLNVIFAYMRDNGFSSLFSEYRRGNMPLEKSLFLEKDI